MLHIYRCKLKVEIKAKSIPEPNLGYPIGSCIPRLSISLYIFLWWECSVIVKCNLRGHTTVYILRKQYFLPQTELPGTDFCF